MGEKSTLTWLVYWIRITRSFFTGAGLKWSNTQDNTVLGLDWMIFFQKNFRAIAVGDLNNVFFQRPACRTYRSRAPWERPATWLRWPIWPWAWSEKAKCGARRRAGRMPDWCWASMGSSRSCWARRRASRWSMEPNWLLLLALKVNFHQNPDTKLKTIVLRIANLKNSDTIFSLM